MAKTVGERIRQARVARKLSGDQLAQMVGYSKQSSIGNLENRATGQGGNRLPAIAKVLGVSVSWLLEGPDSDVVPFVDPVSSASVAEPDPPPYLAPAPSTPAMSDPWILEAVETLWRLSPQDRRAAVPCLRAFVHNLEPPGHGQALPVAA